MPDPTPTTRDRELARKLVPELSRGWDAVPGVERLFARARQEGREEVVQDAARWTKEWDHREGDTMAFELVEHLENRFPPLDQPAPEAKE